MTSLVMVNTCSYIKLTPRSAVSIGPPAVFSCDMWLMLRPFGSGTP